MKKIISRNYAINLIKSGKAIPSCYLKADDNGDIYIAIDVIKGQRTKHFISKVQDLGLFIEYGEYEDSCDRYNKE